MPPCSLRLSAFLLSVFASCCVASPSAVQLERAAKIADTLHLNDSSKRDRVRELIAQQYYDLSQVHAARDAAIKKANDPANQNREETRSMSAQARAASEAAQDKLHAAFLAALATELSSTQIDQVKDGMTYGVVPLTFGVYQKMLPQLTAEQKQQIFAWLVEAREHAMDASTSEEKHAWFGKYKGRINNYLTKAGYDMKAAEKNLHAAAKD